MDILCGLLKKNGWLLRAIFLHSECSPIYPVYTTFDNLAKYYSEKKLGRFLKAIFFCLAQFFLRILYSLKC